MPKCLLVHHYQVPHNPCSQPDELSLAPALLQSPYPNATRINPCLRLLSLHLHAGRLLVTDLVDLGNPLRALHSPALLDVTVLLGDGAARAAEVQHTVTAFAAADAGHRADLAALVAGEAGQDIVVSREAPRGGRERKH